MSSVLIVDDEVEILETLKRQFTLEGLPCEICSDPIKALKMHEEKLYPVILSDIRMKGLNGVELTRKAKNLNPTCQIFIMTGYASLMNMAECLGMGAYDYFKKPFHDLDLITTNVKIALERQHRWVTDLSANPKKAA